MGARVWDLSAGKDSTSYAGRRPYEKGKGQRLSLSRLPRWLKIRGRVGRVLDQLEISEEAVLTGTAVLVGLLTGLGTLISVRGGRRLHVAHGYTVLQPDDRVTVFAANDCLPEVRRRLMTGSAEMARQARTGGRYREFTVPPGATCIGRPVRELPLPPGCILVSVHRGR